MDKIRLGFAMCGSFCTFDKAIDEMIKLKRSGKYEIFPIMSDNAYNTDTRFGKACDFVSKIEEISGRKVIHSIVSAEPLGPKKMIDMLLVLPCTGNTLSKLANGITDTPVLMAVKSSLRIKIPIVLGAATNDALSGSAQNIGKLMNTKHIYFVPFSQDMPESKPTSAVCDFERTGATLEKAFEGIQIEPILF